jgi:hypothetical protein
MPELIYGRIPGHDEHSLLEKETAHKQKRSLDCSTWGEYVQLAGLEWKTFIDEWSESLRRIASGEVNPDTPVDLREIKGQHNIGNLIRDPRAVAREILPMDIDYSEDPALAEHLSMERGSPGPNVGVVTATAADAFECLETVLHRKGHDEFSIEQDESLVRNAYDL